MQTTILPFLVVPNGADAVEFYKAGPYTTITFTLGICVAH